MKARRFQYSYRESASKYHILVGEILRNSTIFKGYEIYQEYPVSKVNPNYKQSNHHFDWVIPRLKLVLEVHGQQHYERVNFGGMSDLDADNALWDQRLRDQEKKEAVLEVGWTYIAIPYYDSITEERILELYDLANKQTSLLFKAGRDTNYPSWKERNREYRRQRYRELKKRQRLSRSRT